MYVAGIVIILSSACMNYFANRIESSIRQYKQLEQCFNNYTVFFRLVVHAWLLEIGGGLECTTQSQAL